MCKYSEGKLNVKPEEVPDLEYIIEKMAGKHTITIELLAHLACSKLWTASRLREELEQKGFQLKFLKNGNLINIQEEYEKIYDLSGLTDAEQNILEAFSIFPYIPLSVEICNRWLLPDAGSNEEDGILMGLYQKGWLQFDWEPKAYAMHPVFAQFIYAKREPKLESHLGLFNACHDCIKIPDENHLLECQKYFPFAESIIKKLDAKKNVEQGRFIYTLAQLMKCSGEYRQAIKWYKMSLEIYKKLLKEDNFETSNIYYSLAAIYVLLNDYGKAEEMYEKSLKIRKRILGENHKDAADIYNGMAFMFECQGEYEKAQNLYEKSLRIYENARQDNMIEIATTYNNLAGLYRRQSNYLKAEELHKESLRIREKVLGKNHLHTAISYRNLAGVYLNTRRYKEAEELYEKNLKIYEKVIGTNHPDTALTYNDLGVVYFCNGNYEKSETYHLKAYKIDFDKLGPEHPMTLLIYNNMKLAHFKKKRMIFNRNVKFKRWLEEKMRGYESFSVNSL